MNAKIIRYSREHVHVYIFENGEWHDVSCRLSGSMDRCTASTAPLPRGTKFDGNTTLTEWELLNIEVQV